MFFCLNSPVVFKNTFFVEWSQSFVVNWLKWQFKLQHLFCGVLYNQWKGKTHCSIPNGTAQWILTNNNKWWILKLGISVIKDAVTVLEYLNFWEIKAVKVDFLAVIKEIAMEKHALKNVSNCWNTKISFYSEKSGG